LGCAQAERDGAISDLEAMRETSKLLEEELASLKQRLRNTEVRLLQQLAGWEESHGTGKPPCGPAGGLLTLCAVLPTPAAAGTRIWRRASSRTGK